MGGYGLDRTCYSAWPCTCNSECPDGRRALVIDGLVKTSEALYARLRQNFCPRNTTKVRPDALSAGVISRKRRREILLYFRARSFKYIPYTVLKRFTRSTSCLMVGLGFLIRSYSTVDRYIVGGETHHHPVRAVCS